MNEVKRYDVSAFGGMSMDESSDGAYVNYEDYAALEAKCVALAAENALIKSAIPEPRDIEVDNDNMDDVSLAEDFGFNHAIELMKRRIPETPATDALLAEVRAQGVELFAESQKEYVRKNRNELDSMTRAAYCGSAVDAERFAAQLRKGGEQK